MFRLTLLVKLIQQKLFTARFINAFQNAWESNQEFQSMLPNSLRWLDPGSLPLLEKFVIKARIGNSDLYLEDYSNINLSKERKIVWGKNPVEFICLEEAFIVLDIVKGNQKHLDINVFQGEVKIER